VVRARTTPLPGSRTYRSNQASLVGLFEARHAELDGQRRLLTLQRDLARVRAQLVFKPVVPGAQP